MEALAVLAILDSKVRYRCGLIVVLCISIFISPSWFLLIGYINPFHNIAQIEQYSLTSDGFVHGCHMIG